MPTPRNQALQADTNIHESILGMDVEGKCQGVGHEAERNPQLRAETGEVMVGNSVR